MYKYTRPAFDLGKQHAKSRICNPYLTINKDKINKESQPFLKIWFLANFYPPASFSLPYNSHQLWRVKADTCFLKGRTWSRKDMIHRFLRMLHHSQRCSISSVAVIDRGKSSPTLIVRTALFRPRMAVAFFWIQTHNLLMIKLTLFWCKQSVYFCAIGKWHQPKGIISILTTSWIITKPK